MNELEDKKREAERLAKRIRTSLTLASSDMAAFAILLHCGHMQKTAQMMVDLSRDIDKACKKSIKMGFDFPTRGNA